MNARRHSSNIGIRRQQLAPTFGQRDIPAARAANDQINSDETVDRSSKGPTKARLQSLRRQELLRRKDSRNEKGDKANGLPDSVSITQQQHVLMGDSDGDSPPALLINPDIDVLPVAKTEQAKGAFDFYVNSYATNIIEVSTHNIASYSHIIHQILHDELLFTAFTTCSEAARWRTQSLYDDAPLSVVRGYGKTITLLTKKLQSERFAMSPAILLTMGQLVAIETMIKNVSATARHLAGMQAVMSPKGGGAAQGGAAPVQKAVDTWTQYFVYRGMVKSQIPRNEPLNYPRHPYDPKLSMQIANLPAGFSDIALSGRISTQILDLLDRFNDYFIKVQAMNEANIGFSDQKTEVVLRQAAWCIEFHQIQTMTIIERLIVTALTAYVVRRDRIHPALVNMRNYYQITCAYLSNLLSTPQGELDSQDAGTDLVVWAGLLLLLTSSPEAHARKLALRLLPKQPQPLKLQPKSQQFFWDEDLTNALLSGEVLITAASNDIIADNVKQALPDAEKEIVDDT